MNVESEAGKGKVTFNPGNNFARQAVKQTSSPKLIWQSKYVADADRMP